VNLNSSSVKSWHAECIRKTRKVSMVGWPKKNSSSDQVNLHLRATNGTEKTITHYTPSLD
jgi:hypothetical protein